MGLIRVQDSIEDLIK